MKVLFIIRSKKLKQFSIERCFEIIKNNFTKDIEIEELYLPCERANIKSIITNILFVKKHLKTNHYDIIQITGDAHYISMACGKNVVLTIHDLRGINNYKGLKRFLYKLLWIKIPVKQSTAIISISEATEKEIQSVTKVDRSKHYIIPDPVDDRFVQSEKTFCESCPRLLLIGTGYNKNVERSIEAVNGISCVLDIVGKLNKEQEHLLKKHNIRYINDSQLSDEKIYEKYCKSDIVLFPSTYEGFGMIIIEGQKVGRVVITSNVEPMKTVAGKGAILVDPNDIDDIRRAIELVISNNELRTKLIALGLLNAEKYSGKSIACEYAKLYRSIIQK